MKKLRVGIFGAGRGADLATNFMMQNCEMVALCDFHEGRRKEAAEKLGDIALYSDFDEFINHPMDAMIVANYFHEHTPYVIKCFEKGIHVFCECISNGTMAEGVMLAKAYEKTNSIFFLAENYPQMKFNLEMQRVAKSGTLGKILYAEGEYNHPGDPSDSWYNKVYDYFPLHWRNFDPRTYYITHSLGPVMRATGATPKTVVAFAAFSPTPDGYASGSYVGDKVAIITTQNDDGSIFRVFGCGDLGAHHNSYRLCGMKGQIENLRGMGEKIMLRYNDWEKPEGMSEVNLYEPDWNDKDEALINASGHGGSDYITARMFIECIRENKQPEHPYDLHSAIAMSSVAILGHRSMLDGGKPYAIPDFKNDADRLLYENDFASPFYKTDGTEPNIPCCSHTDYAPTELQMKLYKEMIGYKD